MSAETFNACVYLVDRQVEAGHGDHLAVTGPAGSLTYAELAARAAELAAGFVACGVRPEERVLLVATDRPETVITFCALLRRGGPRGGAPRPRGGCAPATPTPALRTASTPAWAGPTT